MSQIKLNASKTTTIVFGSPHAIPSGISMYNRETVKFSDTVTGLGVILDNTDCTIVDPAC